MPLLSLADFDKSLKLNQLFTMSPLLNTNLLNAQLNLLTAEQMLLHNVVQQQQQQQQNPKQSSYSRYKTELCRQYSENGQCKYGDKCQFAHGVDELKDVKRHPKYKTDFCKTFHSKGFCPYGPRCHFIHELSESPELVSGLSSTSSTKLKSKDEHIANTILLNLKHELDCSDKYSTKYDCHDQTNERPSVYMPKDLTIKSLNASPASSTTSSNTSLNDLFARHTHVLSPSSSSLKLDTPTSRTRSSVSSTSSCFSTTSSLSTPFDLYSSNLIQSMQTQKNFIW